MFTAKKATEIFGLSRNVLDFPFCVNMGINNERNESPMKKTSCQTTNFMIGLNNKTKETLWEK
tara:strand:+ start:7627 stop:7815 length:189 start_codon:yes stop_codon:yes gene_type:complete